MDKKRKTGCPRKIAFAVLSIVTPLLFRPAIGQQTANGADQIKKDEILQLSPFTVADTADTGYAATETLAGTRIKSNIRDVGATISIVTKKFLEDTGIKNASELLIYTAGTETGGPSGNFSAMSFSSRFGEAEPNQLLTNPQYATRVRGIAAPDLTRDYFLTQIPFDSYNTERVEINRGANAILFGLGSPAGIINNSLLKPLFKDFGEVNARVGQFGSFRSSLDLNKELIKGKVAIRVASLYDREEYQQRPAFEQQKRLYAALTYKPFSDTTLRVNGERGIIDANRPNPVSYSENISAWILSGNPVTDNTPIFLGAPKDYLNDTRLTKPYAQGGVRHPGLPANKQLDLGGGAVFNSSNAVRAGIPIDQGFWQFQSALVYSNPNVSRPDGSLDNLATTDLPNPALATGPHPLDGDPTSRVGTAQLRFLNQEPFNFMYGPGYSTQSFNDRRAFDWVNNLLFGDSAFQKSNFSTFNAAIEQTFLGKSAGIGLVYDQQKSAGFSMTPVTELRGAIFIDNNVTLPVTPQGLNKPNPNYLRPYTFVSLGTREEQDERKAFQATGFYEIDFRKRMNSKWADWLGRHVLTGIFSDQTTNLQQINRTSRWIDPMLLRQAGTDDALNVQASAQQFIYLGPPIAPNADSMDDIKINRLSGVKLYEPGLPHRLTMYDPGIQPGTANTRANGTTATGAREILNVGGPTGFGNIVTRDISYEMLAGGVLFRQNEIKSLAYNMQSFWLSNHLVSTVGWRRDEMTVHQMGAGDLKRDRYNQTIVSGVRATDDKSPDRIAGETLTWSLVGYWPEKLLKLPRNSSLSGHFSRSSNFQPAVGLITEMGKPVDSPRGNTKEYGFTWSMLAGKLSVRVNRYETNLLNAPTPVTNYGSMPTLWIRWYGEGARNIESVYNVSGAPQHAAARNLADAAAELIVSATPAEFKKLWNVQVTRNAAGKITGYSSTQPIGISDTQDVAGKGTEIELAYNPLPNWRLMANATRQSAIKTNVNPVSRAWRAWVKSAIMDAKIPGYNLTVGELPAALSLAEYFPERTGRSAFGNAWAASGSNITANESTRLNFDIPLETAISQEGAVSQELRKWRINLMTTYDFKRGGLKGLKVGGGWRYQSKVAIGYAFKDIDGNGSLDAADVSRPYYGPAEQNVDLWVNYKMPFFERHGNWSVGLNVRNVFATADDIIPIRAHANGAVSSVMYAPQRVIYLSSTFKF